MEETTKILIDRGYPENAARQVAEQIAALSGQFKIAVSEWLNSGKETEVASHGYSTRSLMGKFPGMTYPAALLTIDWLERDPAEAAKTIEKGIR